MAGTPKPLVILAGGLIDGFSAAMRRNVTIVVEKGRVASVEPGLNAAVPDGADIIDASGCTVMPGLMDLHVHLAAPNIVSCSKPDVAHFSRSLSATLLMAARHAQIMLEAGFTTVRDLDLPTPGGNINESIVSLREAFAANLLKGPRLVVGGMVHITASHFDLALPRNTWRDPDATADGPWAFRRMVRMNVRNGVDCMKTCISGGLGTFCEESIWSRNVTFEELSAMVDEAHAFGKQTAAHCHTPDSIRMALDAGVDTIEHCVFTDDDSIARVIDSGKYVIPTLAFRQQKVIDRKRARGTPDFVINEMLKMKDVANASFRKYMKAGAKLAMGTDTNVDPPFGESAYELEVYTDLGMSPMVAIQTATRNSADALGLGQDLGTIAAGKLADILVIDGDPLQDIRVLGEVERIKVVVKNGDIVVDRREGGPRRANSIHDMNMGRM